MASKPIIGAGVAVAVTAGVVFAVTRSDSAEQPDTTEAGTSLATVKEGPLATQITQTGTLSYAARGDGTPYSVINQARGIYTWVPPAGAEIKCGKVLYWLGATPVVLLCGGTPAYRDLSQGDEGKDVKALNDNLVKLGYAEKSDFEDDPDEFTWKTEDALTEFQDDVGAEETGTLDLGDAVFLPDALRITKTSAKFGGTAMPGSPVAEATSTGREVVVDLNAAQQAQVKVGDKAQITLPNNKTTVAKVSRIGTVASKSGDSSTTIPVYLKLQKVKDVGRFDQAPVQVQITTDGVKKALTVPVTALVGQSGGGYAVEKSDAAGLRTVVPVTLGMFDNAGGLVQVTGALKPGDQVVVPAS